MNGKFWLRAESKKNEFRRALSPDSVQKLIDAGHTVVVEESECSIINATEYKKAGATIKAQHSWITDADKDFIIVGLKALPENIETFIHTHIYFAHAYKEQDGWEELLAKFTNGGGQIIDLEYMVDANQRRVAAFGYWAGYVGAALGSLFGNSKDLDLSVKDLQNTKSFKDKSELVNFVKERSHAPKSALVIGAKGRSGSGASDFLSELNWEVMGWDKSDTDKGGPFVEILSYDLLVNCVLSSEKINPFITFELLKHNNKLQSISDVTCDPDSDCNVIPLYSEATTLENPVLMIGDGETPIKLTAIDNLPSILPKESTCDFSSQLEAYLIDFDFSKGPIKASLDVFEQKSKK